jgi:hypothetical protein
MRGYEGDPHAKCGYVESRCIELVTWSPLLSLLWASMEAATGACQSRRSGSTPPVWSGCSRVRTIRSISVAGRCRKCWRYSWIKHTLRCEPGSTTTMRSSLIRYVLAMEKRSVMVCTRRCCWASGGDGCSLSMAISNARLLFRKTLNSHLEKSP